MDAVYESIINSTSANANNDIFKLSKNYFKINGIDATSVKVNIKGHKKFEIQKIGLPYVYVKVMRGHFQNGSPDGELVKFNVRKKVSEFRIIPTIHNSHGTLYADAYNKIISLDKNDKFFTSTDSSIENSRQSKQSQQSQSGRGGLKELRYLEITGAYSAVCNNGNS